MPGSGVASGGEGRGVSVPAGSAASRRRYRAIGRGGVAMLSSRVTEASSDMTLPHPMVAPVWSVLPASDRMVPRKLVVVPRVAALVTAQVRPPVNGPALPASTTSTLGGDVGRPPNRPCSAPIQLVREAAVGPTPPSGAGLCGVDSAVPHRPQTPGHRREGSLRRQRPRAKRAPPSRPNVAGQG